MLLVSLFDYVDLTRVAKVCVGTISIIARPFVG